VVLSLQGQYNFITTNDTFLVHFPRIQVVHY